MTKLKPWDGREPAGICKPYPADDIAYWDMQMDSKGNIWYKNKGKEIRLWCHASRLTGHLIKLGYRRIAI